LNFTETPLEGSWLIGLDRHADERGYFARIYCEETFSKRLLVSHWPQINLSQSLRRGTVRGMHFQLEPHAETKLVRCVRGAIFDVIVDLRRDSPTRHRWFGTELTAANGQALYIPSGFAHGFQCLEEDCGVLYHMSEPYEPTAAKGLRWDDPDLGISWPLPDLARVGPRDASLPTLRDTFE